MQPFELKPRQGLSESKKARMFIFALINLNLMLIFAASFPHIMIDVFVTGLITLTTITIAGQSAVDWSMSSGNARVMQEQIKTQHIISREEKDIDIDIEAKMDMKYAGDPSYITKDIYNQYIEEYEN